MGITDTVFWLGVGLLGVTITIWIVMAMTDKDFW